MFMASNQFKVVKGGEEAFENAWIATRARLREAPGFISLRFHKGQDKGDHVLYFSLTMWEREECFLAWKGVELFRDRPENAGRRRLGPSRLEEFDAMVSRSNPQ